jgi:hypothetical protein
VRWVVPELNTRETALVVWLGAFLLFALTKRDVRNSMGGLLKLVLCSRLLGGVILGAAVYVTCVVLLLKRSGYWGSEMTKLTVLWFVGLALIAVFNTKNVNASYYGRLVLHNLGLNVVVEFLVNLHTFPLPVELVLVPVAFLLVGVQAVARNKPEYGPTRKLTAWCLGLLGAVSLSFALTYAGSHFDEVATTAKAKEFLLPFVLTACLAPFLVALRFLIVYQTMLHMIKFGLHGNVALYRFARRSIFRTCGLNLGKAQLFETEFRGRLWGATTEAEVRRVVSAFQDAWARRRRVNVGHDNPPEAADADLGSITEALECLMYEKGDGETAVALAGPELDRFVTEQSLRLGVPKQAVYDYIAVWATARAASIEVSLAELEAEAAESR